MVKKYFLTYCRNNLKGAQNLMCILSIFFVFGFSGKVFGQSISSPTVGGVPVCAGTDFTISYTVRNGNKVNEKFTTSTNYTAYVGNVVNGTLEVQFSFDFISDIVPDDGNNKETVITQVISIPTDTPGGSNYVIGISSTTPNVNTTTITVSNAFTIKSKPVSNATNNGPVCYDVTSITANEDGGDAVSWSWTSSGSAAFDTATSQNPTITGFVDGEVLTVNIVDINGCTSSATTTVTVYEEPTANATNNGPVCTGGTINLTASSIADATYNWTGPNNYTSNLQNPIINNVDSSNSGDYFVTATVNGCTSKTGTTNVVIITSNTWTGATDTDWNDKTNWSCNSIPNLNLNVIIPGGLTNYPILNSGAIGRVKDIQIATGATLTILDKTLQIAGSVANIGTFDALNGSVAFVGTSAQTIPANVFSTNRISNLIIDNTTGVSSLGNLEITGFLRVENGDFNTGNALTLISNATQTALIDGSGTGKVVGLVKMQRYLDVAFGYKYFSSPFSDTKVGDFSPYMDLLDPVTSFPNFYTYDENREYDADSATTGWKAYTTPTDPLGILKGYALNFGNSLTSPKTVEITGTVNNGNQQIALANNNRTYTIGFNLVGNPYPSPIDWDAVTGWTKTNIDDAIYFFTAGSTNQYTGTYTSYVDGISADGRSSSIIPSMQGFFVHVTNPGNATLGVTNSVRTDNSIPQQFLKERESEKPALIRISAWFENEASTDPSVIYFPHFAALSFEKDKDALKMMNTDIRVPNLYSLTPENKKLSINALPKPGNNEVKKIPLGLQTEKDGWLSIGLQDLQNLPINFNVYLIDSEKRIGQNLSRKPLYRFYSKAGQHESRFHLIFSETELSDPAIAFDEPFSVKTVGGKVMVSLNLEPGQNGILLASTVTGQILDRKTVSEKEIIEIEGIKSSGVYFFSINLKDGMFSKKVLIQE